MRLFTLVHFKLFLYTESLLFKSILCVKITFISGPFLPTTLFLCFFSQLNSWRCISNSSLSLSCCWDFSTPCNLVATLMDPTLHQFLSEWSKYWVLCALLSTFFLECFSLVGIHSVLGFSTVPPSCLLLHLPWFSILLNTFLPDNETAALPSSPTLSPFSVLAHSCCTIMVIKQLLSNYNLTITA